MRWLRRSGADEDRPVRPLVKPSLPTAGTGLTDLSSYLYWHSFLAHRREQ